MAEWLACETHNSRSQVRTRDIADFFSILRLVFDFSYCTFIELLFVVFLLLFAKRGLVSVNFSIRRAFCRKLNFFLFTCFDWLFSICLLARFVYRLHYFVRFFSDEISI